VTVDGTPGHDYDWIAADPVFSPDDRHVAYVADRLSHDGPRDEFVVVDGTESKSFRWVRRTLIFSGDSQKLAYIACKTDPRFDSAEEAAVSPAGVESGGSVGFGKSKEFNRVARTDQGKPIELDAVEERIVPE
jgi:hypothetical protein